MTGILIYRVFYECLTVSLKCSLQHLSSFDVLLVQPVCNSTLAVGSIVTSLLTWETCSCLTTKNVSTENESKRWKRKQRWERRNESAKKQELTIERMRRWTSHRIQNVEWCWRISLGKGLRTQPVLSLILVVIRSQKSSPLPLPWSDRWIFARAIYAFNGFLEVWVSKQY